MILPKLSFPHGYRGHFLCVNVKTESTLGQHWRFRSIFGWNPILKRIPWGIMVCIHCPIPIPRPTAMQMQKDYTGTDSDAKLLWKLL